MKKQIQDLTYIHAKENYKVQEKNELVINQLNPCKFTLGKFKHSNVYFKYFTAFEYFDTLKVLYKFLCPAANRLS